MTEAARKEAVDPTPTPAGGPRSAGAMLRAARERQGLHIAVLAATIKVSTSKLEALEQDRYDALPNATFARALAQSVCRSLKIDPRPVLAMLPPSEVVPLESTVGRLNTPFQERAGREGSGITISSRPLFWAGGVLLAAAVAVYWLPSGWLESAPADPAPKTAAPAAAKSVVATVPAASVAVAAVAQPAASAPVAAPSDLPAAAPVLVAAQLPASAAAAPAMPSSSAPAAPPPGIALIAVSAASWVEVQDSRLRILLSRTLQPGEMVGVDGALPLRMKIGNASGTQLTFRGQPVDLAAYTRDNVARVELR